MIYEKFLLALLFLGFGCRWVCCISNELQSFQKACEEVKDDLQSIKISLGLDENETEKRHRRRTIDDLLANFEQDPNLLDEFEDGDEWYQEYRAQESKSGLSRKINEWEGFHGDGENFDSIESLTGDASQTAELSDPYADSVLSVEVNQKQNNYNSDWSDDSRSSSSSSSSSSSDSSRDMNNVFDSYSNDPFRNSNIGKRSSNVQRHKKRRRIPQNQNSNKFHTKMYYNPMRNEYLKDRIDSRTVYDTYKERQRPNSYYMSNAQLTDPYELYIPGNFDQLGGTMNSNDQYNTNKNDLSHEANYKLSKIEQDQAEKCKGGNSSHGPCAHSELAEDNNPFKSKVYPTPPPKDDEDCSTDHTSNSNDNNRQHSENGQPNSEQPSDQSKSDASKDNQSSGDQPKNGPIHGSHNGHGGHFAVVTSDNGEQSKGHSTNDCFPGDHSMDVPGHGGHSSGPHSNGGHSNSDYNHGHSDSGHSINHNGHLHCGHSGQPNGGQTNENKPSNNAQGTGEHFSEGQGHKGAHINPGEWKQCKNPGGCKSWENVNMVKRNFNPMNEIKLKTSRRLMRKGFGPSLPSYSLADTQRELKLDELLRNMQKKDKKRDPKSDAYRLDALIMGPSNPLPFDNKQLTEAGDDLLKTVSDGVGDQDVASGLVRTKRITDGEEQQRPRDVARKMRLKRSTPFIESEEERKIVELASPALTNNTIHKPFSNSVKAKMRWRNGKKLKETPENRLQTVPEEMKEKSRSKPLRMKRFVRVEDEIFNDNVNEDMEMNDMTPHVRVKREAAKTHSRSKRSLEPESNIVVGNAANSTLVHKLQKRGAEQDAGFVVSQNLENSQGNTAVLDREGIVRDEDYEDVTARKKRIALKNFSIGAELHPFLHDRFDKSKRKEDALNKIEAWLEDGSTTTRKAKSNKDGSKEGEREKHTAKSNTTIKSDLSNNPKPKCHELTIKTGEEPDRQLMCSLRDEILNSSAFTQLENMLKNCRSSELPSTPANTISLGLDDKNLPTAKANEKILPQNYESPSAGIADAAHKKDDRVKLNITISASVMGDEDSNNFIGNGTINVRPGFAEDRERRSSILSEFEAYDTSYPYEKRRANEKDKDEPNWSHNCADNMRKQEELNSDSSNTRNHGFELFHQLDSVLSGTATTDVVQGVYKLVNHNPKLRVLLPSLKRNRQPQKTNITAKSLVLLRTRENEPGAIHSEEMLAQIMENINKLIEKQLRSRSCVPLFPDLSDFYNQILRTLSAQESQRKKRESRVRSLATDFSKAVRAIDPNKIDEKSRIVKKLLKQYDDLPQEDRKEATDMRDDLLMDLVYLRKIQTSQEVLQERRKREVLKNLFRMQPIESEVVKKFEEKYTPAFVKLLKAADFLKEANADV